MFPYSDPTGNLFRGSKAALSQYRIIVHQFYVQFARLANSAFTLLEAFDELSRGAQPKATTIPWIAFPKSVAASFQQIDDKRDQHQDEYVEWRTEKDNSGKVKKVTFTTEFFEHYEALARVSFDALVKGIRRAIPGANPKARDLFGPNFNPQSATPEARASQLRAQAPDNPWNNGEKGILFLTQGANTMAALFQLVGECALPRLNLQPGEVCANVNGACVPERNSDPVVCQAAQNLARAKNGMSLQDPVGIRILKLQGNWKLNGQQIDINDPSQNQGAWLISRNGRRAVLDVSKGVTMGDDSITTGTQVSTRLQVGATVISAPEAVLPAWAKMGQESSRQIV
jgi:hypothetical protein